MASGGLLRQCLFWPCNQTGDLIAPELYGISQNILGEL